MNITINRYTSSSLITQIYESIKEKIHSGELQHGDLLPSIRALAKQTEVSMVTVSKAYNTLEKDGVITTVRGKGTFVRREAEKEDTVFEHHDNRFDWLEEIPDYLPDSLLLRPGGRTEEYDFATVGIHPSLFPANSLMEKRNTNLGQEPDSYHAPMDTQGDTELRKQLAASFLTAGIQTSPDEITLTHGIQQGMDLVCRTFIGPGDVVVAESPANPVALALFRNRGATVLPVPSDEKGMRTDVLEELCKKIRPKLIYTCPSFQNPTGATLSRERREKLIHIALTNKSLILEADGGSDLYFHSPPPAPVKSLDQGGQVIYLKEWYLPASTGMKIGAISASKGLLHRLLISAQLSGSSIPTLTQEAFRLFLQSEEMHLRLDELKSALALRCRRAQELLAEYAPEGITWTNPDGGLYLWVSCPYWLNTDHLYHEAATHGVMILPGSVFYPAEREYCHFRLCFSNIEGNTLEEGILALCKVLNTVIKRWYNSKSLIY